MSDKQVIRRLLPRLSGRNAHAAFEFRAVRACLLAAVSAVTSAGIIATTSADASAQSLPEPSTLIDQQHCMFCHTTDAPFLAPSFRQIAARYRDQPGAQAMLVQKLRTGGPAHWGDTPMPLPAERGGPLSEDDARTLVQWVLSQ